MANLKLDLLNKLNNEKYFDEMELVRLAGEPNMNYKDKVDQMSRKLFSIAMLNAQLTLVGQYFPEQPQVVPQSAPQGQVHQGQSHGE